MSFSVGESKPIQVTGTSEWYHTWFQINKDTVRARGLGLYVTDGLFVVLALFAVFTIGLGNGGVGTAMGGCSENCIKPGVCQPYSAKCVSQLIYGKEAFCDLGWTGEECTMECFCGDSSVKCDYGGVCTECAAGFTFDEGVCTACDEGFTTPEAGTYNKCKYCETNYECTLDGGKCTECTECDEGKFTDAGPHQDETCSFPV